LLNISYREYGYEAPVKYSPQQYDTNLARIIALSVGVDCVLLIEGFYTVALVFIVLGAALIRSVIRAYKPTVRVRQNDILVSRGSLYRRFWWIDDIESVHIVSAADSRSDAKALNLEFYGLIKGASHCVRIVTRSAARPGCILSTSNPQMLYDAIQAERERILRKQRQLLYAKLQYALRYPIQLLCNVLQNVLEDRKNEMEPDANTIFDERLEANGPDDIIYSPPTAFIQ
jgi:hypothetical protein